MLVKNKRSLVTRDGAAARVAIIVPLLPQY
jgi:hypothetical protein